MATITLNANAKITLSLQVLRTLEDGYHIIRGIYQKIGLHDIVTLSEDSESNEVSIVSNSRQIPLDQTNLVWKAASLIKNKFQVKKGVRAHIEKRIPIESGLAGGSADAAATLIGLNYLWKLGLTCDDLIRLGQQIGFDVCYCVVDGIAEIGGKGETIIPLQVRMQWPVLIGYPGVGIKSAYAYSKVQSGRSTHIDYSLLVKNALAQRDIKQLGKSLHNDFESFVLHEYPQIQSLYSRIKSAHPLGISLSGSGSSIFALMNSTSDADKLCRSLNSDGLFAWSGLTMF